MPPPVLINVDDNEGARYARTRLLQRSGFTVFDTGTGEGALQLVANHDPDMVVLDVNLPDISGIDVCRRIKTNPETSTVIVLQVSASAVSAPQATVALNSGADGYLTEPVDPDVLVATIRALIRLRRTERDLAQANNKLKEVNRALQRSNEDLEQFAYVASHDLQEPLRTVTTHVQLLSRMLGERLEGSEHQVMETVVDASRRMSRLIQDVLSYSKVTRGSADFRVVPLRHSLDWALDNLGESIRRAGASIEISDMPVVWGDTVQLGQVFQNLLGNAIKYRGDAAPKIRIAAEQRASDEWQVSISDNGVGISAEYCDRIFVPFKRLHGHNIPGTGIGLALCRRVVESHGGRIWVNSTEGVGSTFYFTLKTPREGVLEPGLD